MRLIIRKCLNRLKFFIYKIRFNFQAVKIKGIFRVLGNARQPEFYTAKKLSPVKDFEYKSEEWEPIHNLNDVLIASANHKVIHLNDNSCSISSKGTMDDNSLIIHSEKIDNNWLCFFYNQPLQKKYSFEFDIKIYNEFKEIQIAFRYNDLANRLRFMIRDNKEAVFEVIKDGRFFKHVFTRPYSLESDKIYHFRIDVSDNIYFFHINNEKIFSIKQLAEIDTLGNGLCLILYNNDASNAVNCEVTNMQIHL